jgi:hypothetical protein
MHFSLRVNHKQIATNSSPIAISNSSTSARSGLASNAKACPSSASTARSAKYRQLRYGGAKWDRSPVQVNDHDLLSDARGVGISYGIYDPPKNRGTVCVGVSHGTPAFAAHSIAT